MEKVAEGEGESGHKQAPDDAGALVAGLTFALSHLFHLQSASPIWALFIISPLTVFFDKAFGGEKYEWTKPKVALKTSPAA